MIHARLHQLRLNDLDNIMTWVNDKEVIGKFTKFNHIISKQEEKYLMKKIIASPNDLSFTIETEKKEHLGEVCIHEINWSKKTGRLALIIGNKKYWGKGYVQSAVRKILKKAFEKYGFNKIWLKVFEQNKKARHTYEKCGFKNMGLLSEKYSLKGKYYNLLKMSVTKKQWEEMR